MFLSFQQTGLHFHDKNLVKDERRNYVCHLRNKYKKNARLSTMHQPVSRALSWDEDRADMAVRRTSDTRLNMKSGRALTLDLTTNSEQLPMTPTFGLDDTVFEVNEETEPDEPLLSNNNYDDKNVDHQLDMKRVSFQKQDEVHSSDQLDSGSVAKQSTSTDNDENSATKDKVDQSRAPMVLTQTSQHTGHLLRQDAMKDPDSVEIQMINLSDKKPVEKQMSV